VDTSTAAITFITFSSWIHPCIEAFHHDLPTAISALSYTASVSSRRPKCIQIAGRVRCHAVVGPRCDRRAERLPIAAPAPLVIGYLRVQDRNPDPAAHGRVALTAARGSFRRPLRAAGTCGNARSPFSGTEWGPAAAPRLVNSVAENRELCGYIDLRAAYVKDAKWRR
jgi:hypothetical protein